MSGMGDRSGVVFCYTFIMRWILKLHFVVEEVIFAADYKIKR